MAATFAQLLGDLHHERFVGRGAELARSEAWLAEPDAPPILAVSGMGGIGKTWLLEELARRAQERGFVVHRWDAGTSPSGDIHRLAATHEGDGRAGTVVVLDAVDALGPAVGELQQALSALESGTRVVLSSRQPLRGGPWRPWEPLTRHVELGPFDWDEQCRYFDLRGIDDPARREQITMRTGGHPLTLSLAVDLILDAGDAFVGSATWRSAIQVTVEELMAEVGTDFRSAIEVAAVLYRLDRPALAAVLGTAEADRAFVRLCAWSASRVVGDQLVLHDEVRRSVVEDLRLHNPRRLDRIRRIALRHYRRQAAIADDGDEAARWSVERLHLVGRDVFGVSFLYGEQPGFTVAPGTAADIPAMLELLSRTPVVPGVPAVEIDPDRVQRILADPHCTALLARDQTGVLRGYGFILRLTERSRRLLGAGEDAMATMVDAAVVQLGRSDGSLPERSNLHYLSTIVIDPADLATGAVLGQDVTRLLLTEGAYIFVPAAPQYVQIVDGLRAQPFGPPLTEAGAALRPRLLDLSRCGFAGWVRAIMADRPVSQIPIGAELASVVADAVDSFHDDVALAASALAGLAEPDNETTVAEQARAVRALLSRGLTTSGDWPSPETRIRDALADAGVTALPRIATQRGDVLGPEQPSVSIGGGVAIHVQVLGRLAVLLDGRSVPIPQGTVAVALELLALQRTIASEELIDLLWPDAPRSVGRDRLRTLLSRIRRAVSSDLLLRQGAQITLGGSVTVDALEFTDAATSALREPAGSPARLARCREAVALYGGELLPADRYSEWTVAPRERLSRLLLDLLDRLADAARATGDTEDAVRWLEQAIDADPYDEDRYVIAAEMLAAAGRRGRALALLQRAQSAAASLGVPVGDPVRELQHSLQRAQ